MTDSTGGDDTVTGGNNSGVQLGTTLSGDARIMTTSTGGNDVLKGGDNCFVNYLYGDAEQADGARGGDDRLMSGSRSPDHMWGDFGSVVPGSETTYGHDTFVFSPENGTDFIYDFHRGEDRIELDGFSSDALTNIEEVDANEDGAVDSIIRFDETNSVTVYGVTKLAAADFLITA
jgi:hypothetical protein